MCLVLPLAMTACKKGSEPAEETTTVAEPEGEKIMEIVAHANPVTMLRLSNYSAEDAAEMSKKFLETYSIYSSGDVCMNGKLAHLSKEDLDALLAYHDRFCRGDVEIEARVIPDLSTTTVTVFENGKTHEFEWSSGRRCEQVAEVKALVSPYFEHKSIWQTIPAKED